jgi:hypothetical protein
VKGKSPQGSRITVQTNQNLLCSAAQLTSYSSPAAAASRLSSSMLAHVTLVLSGFLSVVLPIFGNTTEKFRQLYPLRLVPKHKSSSNLLAACYAPRSLLSGAGTYSTNE